MIAANSDGVWNEQGAALENHRAVAVLSHVVVFGAGNFGNRLAFAFLLFKRRVAQINLKRAARRNRLFAPSDRFAGTGAQTPRRRNCTTGWGKIWSIIKNRAMLGIRKGDDRERAAKEFDSISESAAQAIEEVREITNNLRPHLLDRLGLTHSINAMLKKVSGVVEIESEIDSIDNIFSEAGEIGVYRIVQESLNNVIKHSNAAAARVTIKRDEKTVLIVIEDDGKGFDYKNTRSKSGFGLVGLKERIEVLNGEFSIDSKIGEGTTD